MLPMYLVFAGPYIIGQAKPITLHLSGIRGTPVFISCSTGMVLNGIQFLGIL